MEISLREYLTGHVLRSGMRAFEDALKPWVKTTVRTHFASKHEDDDKQNSIEYNEKFAAWGACLSTLQEQHDALAEEIKTCDKAKHHELDLKRKAIKKQIGQKEKTKPVSPVPGWITECMVICGRRTKAFLTVDTHWDVTILVTVMQGMLKSVFAPKMLNHFEAQVLLRGILSVATVRNDRAKRVVTSESDVLVALRQMAGVIQQCACDDAVVLNELLSHAKQLVQRATTEGGSTTASCSLTATEANAQRLYTKINAWELHVETTMDLLNKKKMDRLRYDNSTISFGSNLDGKWAEKVKELNGRFCVVAGGRHWYFHNLSDLPSFADVYEAMKLSAAKLASVDKSENNFAIPAVATEDVDVTLRLETPSTRMSVPIARVNEIVGRGDTVAKVITDVLAPSARVLIYGDPGVGKDTVMAEVAHFDEVKALGGLQEWLLASSEAGFRRQLVELFAVHRSFVVAGCENDAAAAIAAIKTWLSQTTEWMLFVEDASEVSTTLWDILPPAGGRVVVTSQAPLHMSHSMLQGAPVKLEPISTEASIELLRKMNIFLAKAAPPPTGPTEDELYQRCVDAEQGECYTAPPEREKTSDARNRRKDILERVELGRPQLRKFLENNVGNLPLVVNMCGHTLRADDSLSGVLDLIKLFHELNLANMAGNPMTDKHYFGPHLSVQISVERMRNSAALFPADRQAALTLLAAMSMLDRASTPISLLADNAIKILVHTAPICGVPECTASAGHECVSDDCALRTLAVLANRATLERGREICFRFGLLREPGDERSVGVIHQIVQQCLRQQLVLESAKRDTILGGVRSLLQSKFKYDPESMSPSVLPALRPVAPCVQAWYTACKVTNNASLADVELLGRLGVMLMSGECDFKAAMAVYESALDGVQPDNSLFVNLMTDLGETHRQFGDPQSALKLQEKALTTAEQMSLSPDGEVIVTVKNNMALACDALGMHNRALELQEFVLEVRKGTLQKSDPRAATSVANLAMTLYALFRYKEAKKLEEQVLEMTTDYLPSDHPNIAKAMTNLGATCQSLGEHKKACEHFEKALNIYLDQQHPSIAESRNNLATALMGLKQYDDAKAQLETALDDRKKAPSPSELILASIVHNLGEVHMRMKEFEDASTRFYEAHSIRRRLLPAGHLLRIMTMDGLGASLMVREKFHDAEQYFHDAIAELLRSGCAPGDATLQRCKERLAQVRRVISQSEKGLTVKFT
eukprot:m.52207 g.52207  ORF g.52207 m.52207 type:complete len:1215 (+) comp16504_c0_seq1:381-4025(+)